MKRFLTLLAFLVATISSYAYDCEVDGIYYNLSDGKACVTSGDNWYTGAVVIPEKITFNGTTYSVTSIGEQAFAWCYEDLTSVTIPNSVTSIGDMAFAECIGLTSIMIPNSVTSIGYYAFSGCYGLTSVEIPNSVTSIGERAFERCSGLTTIEIPNSIEYIGNDVFNSCTGLTSVTLPNSLTSISLGMFSECSGLTSVTIPNSVTSIDEWAFNNCYSLTSIEIPNSVESIGYSAFQNAGLTSIEIPNSVTSIGSSAFANCSRLTSIEIPNSVTTIESNVFNGCIGLTSVTLPNTMTSISMGLFSGCTSLTSIEIPNSVTNIDGWAFNNCSSLISVSIPNSVKYLGNDVFNGCTGLTSVTLPNTIASISSGLFSGCTSLTSIEIPNSVTNIDGWAFYYCSSLTSVTISKFVTNIGYCAFNECSELKTVYCYADEVPSTDGDVFYTWNNAINNATLYVPSSSIDDYKSIEPWSQFGTILPIIQPENSLNIGSIYADQNSEDITLSVGLDNESKFTSVTFDIYLSDGVSVLKDEDGYVMNINTSRCNSNGNFTIEGEEQADGAVRVKLNSNNGTMISGDSGELLTIALKTTGYYVAAGNHKFEVKHISAESPIAEGKYDLKNIDGYVRVRGEEEILLNVPTGGYATLCLPFDATLPEGLKAYKATSVKNGKVLLEEQQTIPACTPLIVESTGWNSYYFYGDNSAADKFEYGEGLLKSSLIPATYKQGYVLQELSDGLGFYKIMNKITVPEFRCVLDAAPVSNAPAFVPVGFDENANAISSVEAAMKNGSAVYTLDGKRVNTMEKGKIYVVGGVKMMVK